MVRTCERTQTEYVGTGAIIAEKDLSFCSKMRLDGFNSLAGDWIVSIANHVPTVDILQSSKHCWMSSGIIVTGKSSFHIILHIVFSGEIILCFSGVNFHSVAWALW
jgi:hypothetical protein